MNYGHQPILCPRLGAEWIGRISWLPRAPLGPIFMTGLYSVQSIVPVIKIGPKGALGSHEIRPIHSAPSLGQSIDTPRQVLAIPWSLKVLESDRQNSNESVFIGSWPSRIHGLDPIIKSSDFALSRNWVNSVPQKSVTQLCQDPTKNRPITGRYPPNKAILSKGAVGSTFATEISATTVYSLKVEHPMKWKISLPLHLKRLLPSGMIPTPWVARIRLQRLVFGERQNLHSRHWGVYRGITWSPA